MDFSSTALALSIAIAADQRAAELREHVTPEKFETEIGPYYTIPDEKLSGFYDFIEQSMIAILFSYQALEAFGNLTIQDKLGDTGTYAVIRTIAKVTQKIAWTAPDVERKCSTEEKITEIVPKLLGMSFNKGNTVGQGFAKLKDSRDDVTHLKYHDQHGAAMAYYGGDSSSVFFRMVNGVAPLRWTLDHWARDAHEEVFPCPVPSRPIRLSSKPRRFASLAAATAP